jgi:AraC-like DNA-binding protein
MGVFHVYCAISGMVLSAIIMLRGSWFNKANLFLGAHFIVISFLVLVFSFGFKGDSLFWTAMLMGNGLPFFFLCGPLTFLYVRSVLADDAKLRPADYLHFVPFIIQVVFMMPFYLTSWEHKLSVAQIFQDGDARYLTLNLSLIPDFINSYLGILHLSGYLAWTAYTWLKFKKSHEIKSFNSLSFKFTERWLVLFFFTAVILLLNTTFVTISQMVTPSRSEFMASQPVFVKYTAVVLLIIIAGLLSFPEIMYGIPRIKTTAPADDDEPRQKPEVDCEPDVKPGKEIMMQPKGLLFPEIDQKIENVIQNSTSFLNQDFTIYKLAAELGIPVHHIRFYFTKNGSSFTIFKNKLRINYAKTILGATEFDKFSIEGIGRQAGFTSSASFYTEFKKETGLTPTEYVKSLHDVA